MRSKDEPATSRLRTPGNPENGDSQPAGHLHSQPTADGPESADPLPAPAPAPVPAHAHAAGQDDVEDALMAWLDQDDEEDSDLVEEDVSVHTHPHNKPSFPFHAQLDQTDPAPDADSHPSDEQDMPDAGAPVVNYLDMVAGDVSDIMMDNLNPGPDYTFSNDGDPHDDGTDDNNNPDESPIYPIHNLFDPGGIWELMNPIPEPAASPLSLEPLMAAEDMEEELVDGGIDVITAQLFNAPVMMATSSNSNTLGPSNHGLADFLRHWATFGRFEGLTGRSGRCPWPSKIADLCTTDLTHVQYADLDGDLCDLQGVDWESLGVSRREARERRLRTYSNYTGRQGSDQWQPSLPDVCLPRSESFFRFRRMDVRRDVSLSHFQLRNIVASTARTRVFYTADSSAKVHEFNPVSGVGKMVMRLGATPGTQISTLAADHGVLVAGGFYGEYSVRNLDSDEAASAACHEGLIASDTGGITNHVEVYQSRQSSGPLAAFASNDSRFSVLDVATETFLSREEFGFPLNCTALSPDRRLRVMVGDSCNVLITVADPARADGQPEILHELAGHRDYGFACAWADDGWTVATGFQDKAVKIWDARRFGSPVCTLRAEMAGVRSLRFSPVGSGRRVLVAAEEADFVDIIDGVSFAAKQTVDIFGEIGGVTFDGRDGQRLLVLCCDRDRGGLLQLERCGLGEEAAWESGPHDGDNHYDEDDEDDDEDDAGGNGAEGLFSSWPSRRPPGSYDWPRSVFTEERRIRETLTRRRRKGASLEPLEPF